MAKTEGHTNLPWGVTTSIANGLIKEVRDNNGDCVATVYMGSEVAESIAVAVNNHDKLVEALKLAADTLNAIIRVTCDAEGIEYSKDMMSREERQIREAIKEAEGE